MKFPTQKQTGSMCPCISHDTIVNTYLNTTKSRTPYHKQYITPKNNTPQSNPSYSGPTQNKEMSPTTVIFKQNRRRQSPITTMPPLQIRTTHNNTLVQLQQHKHTTKDHGDVDGSCGGGEPAG